MKSICYIYANHRGGWSIASESAAEIGNFPSDVAASATAALSCDEVRTLDFNSAVELSRIYRDRAGRAHREGLHYFSHECHFWAQLMEIQAGRLTPADELAKMRGEAAETAHKRGLASHPHVPAFIPSLS